MAGRTGLEPATSCVTGRRSNQLNYHPKLKTVRSNVLSVIRLLGKITPFSLSTNNPSLLTDSCLMVGGTGIEPVTSAL